MTGSHALADARDDTALLRFAAQTLLASGAVAAIGIVCLTAMFVGFAVGASAPAQAFGRVNDVAVLVSYLLCAPAVVAVWRLLAPSSSRWDTLLLGLGLGSIAAIVILQAALVLEVLAFEDQVMPVTIALLALGAWFVATGYRGARTGVLPYGATMGLLAALYVGYPFWAIRLGRVLRTQAATGRIRGSHR